MSRRSRSSAVRGGLVLAAVVGLLGGTSATALAHASLEASTPAANSVLEQGPPAIVLDFDEGIETELASIAVYGSDGEPLDVGSPVAGTDDTVVSAAVPALDDGVYAVIWRVTSSDGHVVDGAFSFQVGVAANGNGQELLDRLSSAGRAAPAVRWWFGAARLLSLLGALALIGAGWWFLRPSLDLAGRRSARRIATLSVAAMLAGSAAAFGLFGAEAVAGTFGDALSPAVWSDAATTQTGRMLLLRVTIAIVFASLVAMLRHRRSGWWRGAAGTAAVFACYSFSAAGHANSLDPSALWVAIDMAHLAGIAVWLGGLLALIVAGTATLAEPVGGRFAQRFSAVSTVAVPVIVATGVAQGLELSGGLDDLTDTDWGRLLLVKVTVIVALLAIAGVSRWLLAHEGARSLRRTVVAEAVLGVVVLALAAGMVALPPKPEVSARPFAGQLSSNGLIAAVSLSPGVVGASEIHIVLTPPGGSITPVASVSARVSLPAGEIPASPVTLVREGPNHYSGSVTFPRGGEWTLEVIVQVTETESVLLRTTVAIP
jgi:copper transport protein